MCEMCCWCIITGNMIFIVSVEPSVLLLKYILATSVTENAPILPPTFQGPLLHDNICRICKGIYAKFNSKRWSYYELGFFKFEYTTGYHSIICVTDRFI